jgi:hypothetical protein
MHDLIDLKRVSVDLRQSDWIRKALDISSDIVLNHYNMYVITTRIITLKEPEDHEQS